MDVTYRLQELIFEWDGQKAINNAEKHGVTFEEAAEGFLDPSFRAAKPPSRGSGVISCLVIR